MVEKTIQEKRQELVNGILIIWGVPLVFSEEDARKKFTEKYAEKYGKDDWRINFNIEKKRRKWNFSVNTAHKVADLAIKILQER